VNFYCIKHIFATIIFVKTKHSDTKVHSKFAEDRK